MERCARTAVFLLTGLGVFACTSPPQSAPEAEGPGADHSRVVQSGDPAWGPDQGWSISPEPSLVIGDLNGPEEYQLIEIADAARRSDGGVVVVDRGARAVRLYDAQGTFLKTLGGSGAGPGEFTGPASVLITAGDTGVIWDPALLRATRFPPAGDDVTVRNVDWGTLASRVGVEVAANGGSAATKKGGLPSGLFPGTMEPMADGGLLVRLVEKGSDGVGSGSYRPRSGALRVSGDYSLIDTLTFFGDTEQLVVDAPWGPFSVTPPGARETRLAHGGSPPRVCIGDQEGPEVLCIAQDGERTFLRWNPEPVDFTEDDMAAWREATVSLLDLKLSREQVLEMLDQVPAPDIHPPYSGLFLDPAGNLWVEGASAMGGSDRSAHALVFDPQGRLLGRVALPKFRILDVGFDYVLGVHEDSLEVQYIHIYELRKPPGTGG